MFRPNRIGTPVIHNSLTGNNTNFTLQTGPITGATNPFNAVNAAPSLDFGYSAIHFAGTEALPAGHKCVLGQQFTITAPIDGDARGVEVNGSIFLQHSATCFIRPIFMKLTAAVSGVLSGAASSADLGTGLGGITVPPEGSTADAKAMTYRDNVVVRQDTLANLPGTYLHGFQIYNTSASSLNITAFQIALSMRQLNDQQDIEYIDTRR